MPPQDRSPKTPPRPAKKTPAERAEEFTAEQRRLKSEAAARFQAREKKAGKRKD
jgi:hypothetical protein